MFSETNPIIRALPKSFSPASHVHAGTRIIEFLQNEAALAEALEAIGFVTVEPELLTIKQQLALFSKAEVVVSPGGSGIFNAAFCPPEARIVTIESSTKYVGTHAAMLASLGLRHGIIFGCEDLTDPNAYHKRWTLDIKPAIQIIESFAA